MNVVFGGWGGHLYRDFGGLCFFCGNGCLVGVDVYFTVFCCFWRCVKTEIDCVKSHLRMWFIVLLLHDGITWLHYYTKPNEKIINKRECPLQTQLSKWTSPIWWRSKRGQHRTQTTMSVCVWLCSRSFFLLSIYTKTGGMLNCLFQCVFMYVFSARTIRVVVVVVLCLMYACVCCGVMRLLI